MAAISLSDVDQDCSSTTVLCLAISSDGKFVLLGTSYSFGRANRLKGARALLFRVASASASAVFVRRIPFSAGGDGAGCGVLAFHPSDSRWFVAAVNDSDTCASTLHAGTTGTTGTAGTAGAGLGGVALPHHGAGADASEYQTNALAYSHAGDFLAAGGDGEEVHVFPCASGAGSLGARPVSLTAGGRVLAVCWGCDDARLAAHTLPGRVYSDVGALWVWETRGFTRIHGVTHPGLSAWHSLQPCPSDPTCFLAVGLGSRPSELTTWRCPTQPQPQPLRHQHGQPTGSHTAGHMTETRACAPGEVEAVCFAPCKRYLLVATRTAVASIALVSKSECPAQGSEAGRERGRVRAPGHPHGDERAPGTRTIAAYPPRSVDSIAVAPSGLYIAAVCEARQGGFGQREWSLHLHLGPSARWCAGLHQRCAPLVRGRVRAVLLVRARLLARDRGGGGNTAGCTGDRLASAAGAGAVAAAGGQCAGRGLRNGRREQEHGQERGHGVAGGDDSDTGFIRALMARLGVGREAATWGMQRGAPTHGSTSAVAAAVAPHGTGGGTTHVTAINVLLEGATALVDRPASPPGVQEAPGHSWGCQRRPVCRVTPPQPQPQPPQSQQPQQPQQTTKGHAHRPHRGPPPEANGADAAAATRGSSSSSSGGSARPSTASGARSRACQVASCAALHTVVSRVPTEIWLLIFGFLPVHG